MLEPGDRFPVEKLSVQPEGRAVIFFYPAALTPGCTMEAKGFNDRYQAFRDAGYEVIGVSTDLSDKNEEFRSECGLEFPIVSDEDQSLTAALDGLKQFGDYGTFARRVTYVVDADGTVLHAWDVSDAGEHPAEVLAALTA